MATDREINEKHNLNQDLTFQSEGSKLTAQLVSPEQSQAKIGILLIHGAAAKLDKAIYYHFQDKLAENRMASFSYNSLGVGDSEGEFSQGTVRRRIIDAKNALKFFQEKSGLGVEAIAIVGISMGAHVAARLYEENPNLGAIILCEAAAYPKEAEDGLLDGVDFKLKASSFDRSNSPAFTALKSAKEKLMVAFGQEDRAIPQDVVAKYKELAGEILIIPGINHALFCLDNQAEITATKILEIKIINFIKQKINGN